MPRNRARTKLLTKIALNKMTNRSVMERLPEAADPARLLSQALKNPHAPQAAAARFLIDVAILLEMIGLDVVARRQAATGAIGIIITYHILSESFERSGIPDF